MNNYNEFQVLVVGCLKHEEIAHRFFKLADIFWPEIIPLSTFCTDKKSEFQLRFSNYVIEDISQNFANRIQKGLENIHSEYVLLLLDDYYLTRNVDHNSFLNLVSSLKKNDISYCKLIGLPKSSLKNKSINHTYKLKKNTHYGVSLQPSVWKTNELKRALSKCTGTTAWEVESAFSEFLKESHSKCLTFNKNYLKFKNGVLRGELFPYTNKLLKKNGLSILNNSQISTGKYIYFLFKHYLSMYTPAWLRKTYKAIGIKNGRRYYSAD